MEGRSQAAIEVAWKVAASVSLEMIEHYPVVEFFKTIPLLALTRFGQWGAVLIQPPPSEHLEFSHGKLLQFIFWCKQITLQKNTKPLIDKGYVKKEIKLSKTGKECLSQLATTLPSSELKSTIQSFLQKHRDD